MFDLKYKRHNVCGSIPGRDDENPPATVRTIHFSQTVKEKSFQRKTSDVSVWFEITASGHYSFIGDVLGLGPLIDSSFMFFFFSEIESCNKVYRSSEAYDPRRGHFDSFKAPITGRPLHSRLGREVEALL